MMMINRMDLSLGTGECSCGELLLLRHEGRILNPLVLTVLLDGEAQDGAGELIVV